MGTREAVFKVTTERAAGGYANAEPGQRSVCVFASLRRPRDDKEPT